MSVCHFFYAGLLSFWIFFHFSFKFFIFLLLHEFFGHGYRLRELGVTPKSYEITPYGGYTQFELDEDFPAGDLLAVSIAGHEAEAVLAHQMKMQWMQTGKINGRSTTLYTQTELSPFWYSLITVLGRLKDNVADTGNDIDAYSFLLNETYPNQYTSVSDLARWSLLEWVNPMVFYAYYSWIYYLLTGCSWEFPRIKLSKDFFYLPGIRAGFAPYGPEAYFENFFLLKGKPLYAYVKGGPRSFGFGGEYDHLYSHKWWTIGLHFDAWCQSQFVSSAATIFDLEEGYSIAISERLSVIGFAASLTNRVQFSSSVALFLEAGGKTSGYLPGYALGSSFTGRVGLIIGAL